MDILLSLLVGLLVIGLVALIVVFKFDRFMSIRNIIKKDDKDNQYKE